MPQDPVIGVLSPSLFKLQCLQGYDDKTFTSSEIEGRELSIEDSELLRARDAEQLSTHAKDHSIFAANLKSTHNLIYKWQFPVNRIALECSPHSECGLDDLAILRAAAISDQRLSYPTIMADLTVTDEIHQGIRHRYTNLLANSIPKEPCYLKSTTCTVMKRQNKYIPYQLLC